MPNRPPAPPPSPPTAPPAAGGALRAYAVVTLAYWVFTLTDGALRMLVLLRLHALGHPPLEIASLFLFYEAFGVVTTVLGGWLGARFGLGTTLGSGLLLQVAALGLLAAGASDLTVPLVLVAQALSGIAKDLVKTSAKSWVRLLVPPGDHGGLLRLVALLTGSKNALKGIGFFLGGLLLALVGFRGACVGMAVAVGAALLLAQAVLPRTSGRSATAPSLRSLVPPPGPIRWLSASRLFLFGARDTWFVLALPIFLEAGLGWSSTAVGAFLAAWVIGYGIVQAAAPRIAVRRAPDGSRQVPTARVLAGWTFALVLPLAGILAGFALGLPAAATLAIGLAVFGAVFATDSAIHSFLIVHYAEGDKVALRVGFYYMANAMGRLVGTVLSGAVFQAAGEGEAGLLACIAASLGFVLVAGGLCVPLGAAERRAAAAPADGAPAGP